MMDENFYSHILSVSNKHPLFLKYILRTVEISPLQGWDRGVGKIVGGALKKGDYHLCSPKFFLALCFSVCVYVFMLVCVCVLLSFTSFLSYFLCLPGKDLVFLNLVRRYATSARE